MESLRVILDFGFFKGFFNVIWIYRSDFDFFVVYVIYVFLRLIEKVEVKVVDYIKGKMKFVVWMVSNCGFCF